jgi:hypothetical protein
MRYNHFIARIFPVALIVFLVCMWPLLSSASMSSTNYSIQTDSLNFGGENSSSTSYGEQDTLGEIATGLSSSTDYAIGAGYQQMLTSFISLSSAANVTLPSISGIMSGTSMASSTWVVTTDDTAGYQLSISAGASPALTDPAKAYFADYTPSGGAPDFAFTTSSGTSNFGYSVVSPDATQFWKNNGSACNTGSSNTSLKCWEGFSTITRTIAQSSGDNQPNGASTTVSYEAAVGSNKIQDAGTYTATVTVTAVAL